MRITGNKPVTGVQGRSGKKIVSGDDGGFQPDTGETAASSASVSGGSSIQGMDALLALQEVRPQTDQRQAAARRGHALLDRLENLKTDLLAGHVSEERLTALAEAVEEHSESGDEKVDEVIREIELRVKVELAKLGRFSG